MHAMDEDTPLLGPFWGIPRPSRFELLGFPLPFGEVPLIAGFRTVDWGHYELWPILAEGRADLHAHDYDYFPRGRVSWIAADEEFLILLDRRLKRADFLAQLSRDWRLGAVKTRVGLDAHYRCRWRP